MKNFVVDIQGRQLGPFTAAELRAMAAAGSLPHDALIHDRDSGRRMIASSVAGLVFPQASNGHPATGMPPLPAQRRGGGAVDSTRDARGAATRRPAASPPPRRFKSSDITEATAEPYEFESVGDDGPDDLVRVPRPLEWGADLATESPRATKILGSPTQGPLSGRINGRPVLIWISVGATAAVALVIGLLAVVFLWSGSDRSGVLVDTDVRAVQSGRLENCSERPVGEMLESFLTEPKWRSVRRADGSGFVNCRGGLVYEGKPAIAEFQFRDAGGSISLVSLEIDGQPQSQMTQAALMRRMCGN
jgi:hypothetical protein